MGVYAQRLSQNMTTQTRTVPMTRHERKDALGHGAVKQIAAELECSPSLVSRVVNGKATSARVARAVAARIGLPVELVFGGQVATRSAA